MRLLPDIIVDGYRLSLQDPYTIDGELILDFSQGRDTNENVVGFIKTYNYMKPICRNVFDEILRYSSVYCNFQVTDERGFVYDNPIHCYQDYVREITRQILSLRANGNRRNEMLHRLRQQNRSIIPCSLTGRLEEDGTIRWEDSNGYAIPVRNTTPNSSRGLRRIEDPTLQVSTETLQISSETFYHGRSRTDVFATSASENYIHPYNYKPTYIPHTLDFEKTPLLLGAEIEVAGNKDSTINTQEVVKKCIQIMNSSDSVKEDLIYSTHDGSVQIELDTMPCSLEYHKQKMNYQELFSYLDKKGYKGHDCQTAGLHIHADRSYLGDTPLKQQLVISKILYILEKFNDEICVIARRNNQYSAFAGNGKDEDSVVELYKKYQDKGKHVALNLKHKETIEFRCFKSTLKYETFILTLEFVQDIINYAKQINIEDIESIKWEDLMNTFSQELKNYYEGRLKKQNSPSSKFKDMMRSWVPVRP